MDETRLRITEAAMRLHTSVGPSAASLVAIADAAGVTRATLYRHFASADELFGACMRHWTAMHPPPDAAAWLALPDFESRVRLAFRDLYGWYARNDRELFPIYRDSAFTPPTNQAERRAIPQRIAGAIMTGISLEPGSAERVRAALLHFVAYPTWRSLTVDAELSSDAAADLAASCVLGLART